MTDENLMTAMADEPAPPPPAPEPGVEMTFPLAALTAAGENPGEENQPEKGDAVAIQLEATFLRAENGMGIVRVSKANGQDMAAPGPEPSEDVALELEGEALRRDAEKGGY